MLRALLSVGGFTLLSRVTGFLRDVVMAAVLGAGGLMDLFAVALRLPNHFRAIFGEGAFSAAFVPAFTRIRTQEGPVEADLFHGRILAWLLGAQVLLLVVALAAMPAVVGILAPGFAADPGHFALAVELTRITFPYLLLITLVTLWSGVLNAAGRFAAAAAAPVLLNLALLAAMAMAALFPTAAHAAAWGVLVAGVLEAALLAWAAWRAGLLVMPLRPRLGADERGFFRSLGPAVIGSAGVQIAMFADTILATLLPTGSAAALYYADRIYQLPMGVIAVAAGTVLLPAMSQAIAAGDDGKAHRDQNRVVALVLLLAAPCWAAVLVIPEAIMLGIFARGAFDAAAAERAAGVLAAYGVGMLAALTLQPVVKSFQARGDTTTPMVIALAAVGANVLLKLVLVLGFGWGVKGLALATSLGATLNLAALLVIADRRHWIAPDRELALTALVALVGALAMGALLKLADSVAAPLTMPHALGQELRLIALAGLGAVIYGGLAGLGIRLFGLRPGRLRRA